MTTRVNNRMIEGASVNILDFGADPTGSTDSTSALDQANTIAITERKNLIIPEGRFVYNGTGLSTNNNIEIIGKGQTSIIDCSSNTNSGHAITLNGFRTAVRGLTLIGNDTNPLLRGIRCYYNNEVGALENLAIEGFHYGIDLDRLWYFSLDNIRLKSIFGGNTLTGSHITIGEYHPTEEVNNIVFKNIWMGDDQKHCVTIKGPTQALMFMGCSFETKDTRILFQSSGFNNTTTLEGCYLEGTSASVDQIARSDIGLKRIRIKTSLIRMSGAGNLVRNIEAIYDGCFGNNPNSSLVGGSGQTHYDSFSTLNTTNLFNQRIGGTYSSGLDATNFEFYWAEPRTTPAQDYNSTIPKYVHQKQIAGSTPVPIFDLYLPVGEDVRRMRLDVDITGQCTEAGEWSRGGTQKWVAVCYRGRGTNDNVTSGHRVTNVVSDSDGTFMSPTGLTIEQVGYDSSTDSNKFRVYYNLSSDLYPGECFFEIQGSYFGTGPSDRSYPWRIEKI